MLITYYLLHLQVDHFFLITADPSYHFFLIADYSLLHIATTGGLHLLTEATCSCSVISNKTHYYILQLQVAFTLLREKNIEDAALLKDHVAALTYSELKAEEVESLLAC